MVDDLTHEAALRWDTETLRAQVLESQRRRRYLAPVLVRQDTVWDYAPSANAGSSYIRNTMSISEIERRSRYPAV